jgi:hypothetical protein
MPYICPDCEQTILVHIDDDGVVSTECSCTVEASWEATAVHDLAGMEALA